MELFKSIAFFRVLLVCEVFQSRNLIVVVGWERWTLLDSKLSFLSFKSPPSPQEINYMRLDRNEWVFIDVKLSQSLESTHYTRLDIQMIFNVPEVSKYFNPK